MTPSLSPSVLVIQTGARHGYALPSAFAEAGMLERLETDLCAGPLLSRLAGLPGPLGRLGARRVPDCVLERTRMDAAETLRAEAAMRLARSAVQRRDALAWSLERRGRRMAGRGLGGATHLFSTHGEGGALLRRSRGAGVPVLTDVVVSLSARAVRRAEWRAHLDWGPEPAPSGPADVERDLLEMTDVFVCPSRAVASDLARNWGVPRAALRVIPYAPAAGWTEARADPVRGRVLFAGAAVRRKGIHVLAEAARILAARAPEIEVMVAGPVHPMVRDHPGARALRFLGRLPRSAMREAFAGADVFALPTLAEGSATVVYEAMALGLPVVTTAAAGSVIEDGIDGVIVPERDAEALADALERLVEDRRLRDAMGAAARETMRRHSPERRASALRALVRATPTGVSP